MSLQTTRINSANAVATGTITIALLEETIDHLAKKASKNVKIPGFRVGKVPTHIIKARHKDSLENDAKSTLVKDFIAQALRDLELDASKLIGEPVIKKFQQEKDEISLEIALSILPEFSLEGIEEMIPMPSIPTPESKDIQERLDQLAEAQGELVASSATMVQHQHIVTIDFEGFIDGEAFSGGKAEGFALRIGSGQFIPGFEEALLGAHIGEEKDISVTFPSDYHATHLAGKQATFKVKIHNIQERIKSALDDDLARKILGNNDATLSDLEKRVAEDIAAEMKNRYYHNEMRQRCLEAFDEGFLFDLPEVIVEQEMDVLFRNALSRLQAEELKTYQQDEKKALEKREEFREEAKKSVKVTFIIDAIARAKNITVNDNEVAQAVYYEAMMRGQNPKEMLENYQQNRILPAIRMAMVEDRVLRYLLDAKAGLHENTLDATQTDASHQ